MNGDTEEAFLMDRPQFNTDMSSTETREVMFAFAGECDDDSVWTDFYEEYRRIASMMCKRELEE
jgi:hypothetical protein